MSKILEEKRRNIFLSKSPEDRLNHLEKLIKWISAGITINYIEEEFNACTKQQKETLIQYSRQFKPFELAYIREMRINTIIND